MKNLSLLLAAKGQGAPLDKAHSDGIRVAGTRYVVTRAEDRSVYGREV